ncbi:MAG: TrkH family potassium uptake protein [Bacteroidales bacterium]|nr:TrkH family potassium uptake protein [Bacteroidales bacterium]
MNWRIISRNVGMALLASSVAMFLSVLFSLADGKDSTFASLLVSAVITFLFGIFPFIFVRKSSEVTLKEGYVIIVLAWFLSFIFGMLPYALWGGPFTIENAWFESVSGFTSTGATILENVEEIPRSLIFWRSSTHFIGGLGVVVYLLLIIPTASPVRLRLTNMELSTISRSGSSMHSNKLISVFAYVYLAIWALAFVSYIIAGMSPFDALNHAMSVCATGGFSSRTLSIGAFDSLAIEVLTIIFMILSSLHFGLLYMAAASRSLKPLNNPIIKFFLLTIVVFALLESLSLKLTGVYSDWGKAFRYGTFQTVSTISTTGFAVADNSFWPLLPSSLMLLIAVMCGCAGSTTGGVKVDRVLILLKGVKQQIVKILKPFMVSEVKIGGKTLKEEEFTPQVVHVGLYFLILALSVIISLAFGMNEKSAFAGSLCSLSNVGPAIAEIGNFGNFNGIPSGVKFLYSIDMFLGRLEIFPLLAVVAMIFGPHRR